MNKIVVLFHFKEHLWKTLTTFRSIVNTSYLHVKLKEMGAIFLSDKDVPYNHELSNYALCLEKCKFRIKA